MFKKTLLTLSPVMLLLIEQAYAGKTRIEFPQEGAGSAHAQKPAPTAPRFEEYDGTESRGLLDALNPLGYLKTAGSQAKFYGSYEDSYQRNLPSFTPDIVKAIIGEDDDWKALLGKTIEFIAPQYKGFLQIRNAMLVQTDKLKALEDRVAYSTLSTLMSSNGSQTLKPSNILSLVTTGKKGEIEFLRSTVSKESDKTVVHYFLKNTGGATAFVLTAMRNQTNKFPALEGAKMRLANFILKVEDAGEPTGTVSDERLPVAEPYEHKRKTSPSKAPVADPQPLKFDSDDEDDREPIADDLVDVSAPASPSQMAAQAQVTVPAPSPESGKIPPLVGMKQIEEEVVSVSAKQVLPASGGELVGQPKAKADQQEALIQKPVLPVTPVVNQEPEVPLSDDEGEDDREPITDSAIMAVSVDKEPNAEGYLVVHNGEKLSSEPLSATVAQSDAQKEVGEHQIPVHQLPLGGLAMLKKAAAELDSLGTLHLSKVSKPVEEAVSLAGQQQEADEDEYVMLDAQHADEAPEENAAELLPNPEAASVGVSSPQADVVGVQQLDDFLKAAVQAPGQSSSAGDGDQLQLVKQHSEHEADSHDGEVVDHSEQTGALGSKPLVSLLLEAAKLQVEQQNESDAEASAAVVLEDKDKGEVAQASASQPGEALPSVPQQMVPELIQAETPIQAKISSPANAEEDGGEASAEGSNPAVESAQQTILEQAPALSGKAISGKIAVQDAFLESVSSLVSEFLLGSDETQLNAGTSSSHSGESAELSESISHGSPIINPTATHGKTKTLPPVQEASHVPQKPEILSGHSESESPVSSIANGQETLGESLSESTTGATLTHNSKKIDVKLGNSHGSSEVQSATSSPAPVLVGVAQRQDITQSHEEVLASSPIPIPVSTSRLTENQVLSDSQESSPQEREQKLENRAGKPTPMTISSEIMFPVPSETATSPIAGNVRARRAATLGARMRAVKAKRSLTRVTQVRQRVSKPTYRMARKINRNRPYTYRRPWTEFRPAHRVSINRAIEAPLPNSNEVNRDTAVPTKTTILYPIQAPEAREVVLQQNEVVKPFAFAPIILGKDTVIRLQNLSPEQAKIKLAPVIEFIKNAKERAIITQATPRKTAVQAVKRKKYQPAPRRMTVVRQKGRLVTYRLRQWLPRIDKSTRFGFMRRVSSVK